MYAEDFVKIVVDRYINYKGIFKDHKNAEDLIPKCSDKNKALFLFYVIQLDYATKSQNLYTGAKKLFDINSNFYNPEYILNLTDEKLKEYLTKYLKPRYVNEAVNRYKMNSHKLLNEYNNNPLLVFTKSNTAKKALKRIKEFRGFGDKIGNFYVRTMVNVFNINYLDIEDMLPPVDVHDVKVAYLMEYIDSSEMTKKNILKTKELWSSACKKAGISWLVFDKALWLLGSEGKPKSKKDIYSLLEI